LRGFTAFAAELRCYQEKQKLAPGACDPSGYFFFAAVFFAPAFFAGAAFLAAGFLAAAIVNHLFPLTDGITGLFA
jgi:hypothetical protein